MTSVFDLDVRHDLSFAGLKDLLGGKAANLSVMAVDLGLPVPPAFTIATAACRDYLANGWPDGLDAEIGRHMTTIEQQVGRRFGDPADPLLVSVRSGAPVSMPGMLDTILDLGLNDETTRGLAAVSHDPSFAADCRTRFEAMFRATVGVEVVPTDPWVQLRAAIEAVFRSWNSDRARTYRRREGISDELGTAVTVQAMVFGNRGADSASGVLFTRDPATGAPTLYGDLMFDAQGEDVVAGTHPTESLAELAIRLPSVADELDRYADVLERHHADLCDIEFTIERGKLWLLQCRVGKRSPQAALRIAVDMAEADDFPLTRRQAVERVAHLLADPPLVSSGPPMDAVVLTTGLPASPGMATGEIATTPAAAVALAEAGRPVILVREQTSPDDVHGMARAAGLLTSLGGLASHAAVVARGWGIPAVVGAAAVVVGDDAVTIGGRMLGPGSSITIDGNTGAIFQGSAVGTMTAAPEAETLRGWARELGIEVDGGAPISNKPAAASGRDRSATTSAAEVALSDILASLAIRGYATQGGLAEALFSTPAEIGRLLDDLIAKGLVEAAVDAFRLTSTGTDDAARMLAADRERWGTDRATAALDTFVALDGRLKETVTAWQMREVDGATTFNDHADLAYDAHVLAQLAALHEVARGWLAPIVDVIGRYRGYRDRLDRAARLAAEGDVRFVASPRIDSYHSVWFELHEDLILMSGRTRAEEVAAGRA